MFAQRKEWQWVTNVFFQRNDRNSSRLFEGMEVRVKQTSDSRGKGV